MKEALNDRVRRLRKAKKMTLESLAEASGSSRSYIWEVENRPDTKVSADKLLKIATALDTTVEFLLAVDESPASEEDATDRAFYRKYRSLDDDAKSKIRKMVDLWDD